MLHFTQTIPDGGVAVWHIEEDESELVELLTASGSCMAADYAATVASWRSESRRKEWLAVRILVARCLGAGCRIAYLPSGRPYVADGSCRISISHTKGFAAIVWHARCAVGIDIEQRSERVMRVRSKFVNAAEQELASTIEGALCIWCAKETAYKILDTPTIDLQQEVTVTVPKNTKANRSLVKMRCIFSSSSQGIAQTSLFSALASNVGSLLKPTAPAGLLDTFVTGGFIEPKIIEAKYLSSGKAAVSLSSPTGAVSLSEPSAFSLRLPMTVVSEPRYLLVWAVCS